MILLREPIILTEVEVGLRAAMSPCAGNNQGKPTGRLAGEECLPRRLTHRVATGVKASIQKTA